MIPLATWGCTLDWRMFKTKSPVQLSNARVLCTHCRCKVGGWVPNSFPRGGGQLPRLSQILDGWVCKHPSPVARPPWSGYGPQNGVLVRVHRLCRAPLPRGCCTPCAHCAKFCMRVFCAQLLPHFRPNGMVLWSGVLWWGACNSLQFVK